MLSLVTSVLPFASAVPADGRGGALTASDGVKSLGVTTAGLCISGGSYPGIMASQSLWHALKANNIMPAPGTEVGTVSGGSMGTAVAHSNPDIAFPTFDGKTKWSYADLNTTKWAGGNVPVTAVLDAQKPHGIKEFVGAPEAAMCGGGLLLNKKHNSPWYCIVWFLLSQYKINPGKVHLGMKDLKDGPYPWHVTFSLYSADPGHGLSYPLTSNWGATDTIAKYGLSVASFSTVDGVVNTGPYSLPTSKRYLGDVVKRTTLSNGVKVLVKNVAHKSIPKWINLPLSLDTSTEEEAEYPDVTTAYAISYSSSFINQGMGMYDPVKKAQCPLHSDFAGMDPAIYNYGTGIETTIDGKNTYSIAVDGGATDVLGIVPLLRLKKTSILAQIDFPYASDSDGTGWKHFFGQNATSLSYCHGYDALNANYMGVFDANNLGTSDINTWDALNTAIKSTANSGVHLMTNVPVKAVPTMGVEAYTIDTLVVIDNNYKDGFGTEVLEPDALKTLMSTTKKGKPLFPCTESHNSCGTGIDLPGAVALSMLYQWKVANNVVKIKQALKL